MYKIIITKYETEILNIVINLIKYNFVSCVGTYIETSISKLYY